MSGYQLTDARGVVRLDDNAFIPDAADNLAWREYQAWCAEGNTPAPYVAPPPGVPSEVTMRQARLALLAAGKLDAVNAAIAALSDPQKVQAQIAWDYSSTVQRHQGLVLQLAPALGLGDADLDALFTQAQTL